MVEYAYVHGGVSVCLCVCATAMLAGVAGLCVLCMLLVLACHSSPRNNASMAIGSYHK